MVDNFKLIRDYLKFESEDDFYFLQILQRKKDGPGLNGVKVTGTNNKSRAIKTYCISSVEYLDKIEREVKHLCDYFNARAMIILSRRSYEQTALLEMVQVSNMIMSGQYMNVKSAYNSSCAKSKSLDKYFLIDIDEEDLAHKELIKNYIQNEARNDEVNYGERILLELPTKHGYHLITTPFDVRGLLKVYPKEKQEFVHKDGPTILYVP